jgi:PTS system cellobiose-specific IIC component
MEDNKTSSFDKFVMFATKIGNQVHLRSVRDAFATLMPLFILAGLSVLINNVVFPFIFGEGSDALITAQQFGTAINNGTLNVSGMLLCPAIAYFLSKNKNFDNPFSASIMALATLVVMMPLSMAVTDVTGDIESTVSGILSFSKLGTSAMFGGIVIGLLETELFIFLAKNKHLKISLGDGVPPAVANSFNVLIPAIISISFFSLVSLVLNITVGQDLVSLIVLIIQEPLRGISTSLIGYLFLYSLGNLFFTFGIHQSVINGSFTEPFMQQNINENMAAFAAGKDIPHILTGPFQTSFAQMGGTGATISLIIAVYIFTKFKPYREVVKLATAPGIFEINEPIIFGLPIVFNIPMMIPFVALPAIQTIIAYFATAAGLVSKTVVMIPWVTPPIISGYLATAGDIRASILQIILIALGVIIYMPFLKISEQVSRKQAEIDY